MMKNTLLIFCCLIASLIDLTIQRHLNRKIINLKSLNSSPLFHLNSNPSFLFDRSFSNHQLNRSLLNKSIPIYLIKKPIKLYKKSKLKKLDKNALEKSESNRVEHIIDVNNLNRNGDIMIIDDNGVRAVNAEHDDSLVKKIERDQPVIIENLDDQNMAITPEEEKLIAKRFDDLSLTRKLGGLTTLTSLLSTSQRRISPLNKLILGLLGPKLIKFQLDMMFGAVISELVKKLLMPVLGFVIDKNMPSAMQTAQQPQVPYSTQLEQLQNAYANLQTSTQSPLTTNQQQQSQPQQTTNYVNHPSYSTSYQTTQTGSTTAQANPYVYYGQAQLANYLASQPQLAKLSSQSEEQNQQTSTTSVNQQPTNQLAVQQLSQQLNQLINQYASSINQQANQQANQQTNQQTNQQHNQQSPQTTLNDQNSQIYQQLQGLLQEQAKLKNQLEQLNKPRNYFAKELDLDPETKEDNQSEDELKEAPLNQVEQELDRAQRWNTVLKNMDHFYNNDTLSAIK